MSRHNPKNRGLTCDNMLYLNVRILLSALLLERMASSLDESDKAEEAMEIIQDPEGKATLINCR